MTSHAQGGPRRLRAALVGLGLDRSEGPHRITRGPQYLMVGGSSETHDEVLEAFLRLESELDRLGRGLEDFAPEELADIAWRVDLPELFEIALRLDAGLKDHGRGFHELSAEELTELATPAGPP